MRGESVYLPIPGVGLELRLAPYELEAPPSGINANAWDITIGPSNARQDYMWIVSPPWGTAPHRIIGAAYNLSAKTSLLIRRDFRFVLDESDYAEARRFYDEVNGPNHQLLSFEQEQRRLALLGKGTLALEIKDFKIQSDAHGEDTNFIDWFTFTTTACVPK